jgi:hypothetical protein
MPSTRGLAIGAVLTIAAVAFAQGRLKFDPPPEWKAKPAASAMRVAEFALPPADGEPDEAMLVVYFFGGQGGSVEANLERWIGQMQQPDGRPSKDLAKRTTATVHGLNTTMLDVTGNYVAETAPGSGERVNRPNYQLKAAVIETPAGPYFVKLTGPAKTVAKWAPQYDAFLKSMRVE